MVIKEDNPQPFVHLKKFLHKNYPDSFSLAPCIISQVGDRSFKLLKPKLIPIAEALLQDLDRCLLYIFEVELELVVRGLVHVDVVPVLKVDPEEDEVSGNDVAQVPVVGDVRHDGTGAGKLSGVVPAGSFINRQSLVK